MLLYHLVMAGFDCRDARVLTYGYNVSVVLQKVNNGLTRHSWADMEEAPKFLPPGITVQFEQFNGAIRVNNWAPMLNTPPHSLAGIPIASQDAATGVTAHQLRALIDTRQPERAANLLKGIDLDIERDAEFDYLAGAALGEVGRRGPAIALLKRAASRGFSPFWCAYRLGVLEKLNGECVSAAAYLTTSLILHPEQSEIMPMLEEVAPAVDLTRLGAAQSGVRSRPEAVHAFDLALDMDQRNRPSEAAFYYTIARSLDPDHDAARIRLLELVPDMDLFLRS